MHGFIAHQQGLYVWSEAEEATRKTSLMKDYALPLRKG